ncbi:ESX secretion-associated protein EspG [Nocardia sp. NPDC057227]|uniref:ESX secretion-associated protein EspG n=1 Tax=Nocardia sp. NPDC057227 TaxID=3346056 RepID=UPI00362690F8
MTLRWFFTDLEFVLLCDSTGRANIPDPFTFTSRIALAEEYEAERKRVLAELRDRDDPELRALADAVARPDVSLAIRSWDEKDYADPEHQIRVHAVRSRARGYVITQRPGETVFHSGGFDVVECDPHAVADEALGCLPYATAGRSAAIPLPGADTGAGAERFDSVPGIGDEVEEDDRGPVFLATPATRTGDLVVYQGRSKFGPRGRVGMALDWRDLPEDGRYVIRTEPAGRMATGMGTKGMVEWVNEQIAEILLRLDRHMENEE